MSNIVTIAYSTEGTTDQRFLESVIRRTFEDVASECEGDIEVFDPFYLKFSKKNGFVDDFVSISREAFKNGINVLCIHVDADAPTDKDVFNFKIQPAREALQQLADDAVCKIFVAIIPVQMSEAWMLADKELFKDELGTDKTDIELEISKNPETMSNPKSTIENAIRISQAHLPKRRNRVTIAELYQPIGQKIAVEKLEALSSFRKFKLAVRNAFKELNYLK